MTILDTTSTSSALTSHPLTPHPLTPHPLTPHPLEQDISVNITSNITANITSSRSVAAEPLEPDSPRPPGARTPVARCADGHGTMTGLFFSDHVVDIARAKAMCGLCPLQAECLAGALERQEPWGVWGGELLSGGRVIANKRACGRPPKHPRPIVVIDELGPVAVA